MTPQEIRNIRLANDYKEMCNIRGSIVQWIPTKGVAPYIEEYELTINIKSIVGDSPNYRSNHVIRVTLPANYPNGAPDINMISQPYVFHPNWFSGGKWCYGSWFMSETLGNHVIRMIRTLQYDKDITNENSPANHDAKNWYLSKFNSNLFPCDRSNLPDPTKSKFKVNDTGKKKFEIKS